MWTSYFMFSHLYKSLHSLSEAIYRNYSADLSYDKAVCQLIRSLSFADSSYAACFNRLIKLLTLQTLLIILLKEF